MLEPEQIVRLERDALVEDDHRLPDEEVELRCGSAAEVADAIRTLAVRGAPAIGVAAAYGLALAAPRGEDLDVAYARRSGRRNRVFVEDLLAGELADRQRYLDVEKVIRAERTPLRAASQPQKRPKVSALKNKGG